MKNTITLLILGLFLLIAMGCGTADNPVRDIKEIEVTTGTIRGNIEPIEGVTYQVRLLQDGQLIFQTEAKSIYFLKKIEAGDYTLTISAPGYEKSEHNVTVYADETVSLDMVTLVELAYPVSNITGQLSNARTGVRLTQTLIRLTSGNGEEYKTLTINDGIFTFENLPVNQHYTVTIKVDGFVEKEIKIETVSADETIKLYVRISPQGIEENVEPPLPGKGLDILSEAPDFELPDGYDKLHTLNDFLEDGKKVVLVFYRGGLWPPCLTQLGELEKNYDNIKDKGAELIAISNDTVEETKETVEDSRLTFTVLSDVDIEAIAAYNVNDPETPGIAVPSTFIIEPDGIIVWKTLDTVDVRVSTTRILTELDKLW